MCEATTVNLSLRTPVEQQALVAGFGSWLNALTGPVQILVRSHRLDLTPLIGQLEQQAAELPHPLLEDAAWAHAEYLARLAGQWELRSRQILVIHREPASDQADVLRVQRRAQESTRLLAAADVRTRLLDRPGLWRVLAQACDPNQPPQPAWPSPVSRSPRSRLRVSPDDPRPPRRSRPSVDATPRWRIGVGAGQRADRTALPGRGRPGRRHPPRDRVSGRGRPRVARPAADLPRPPRRLDPRGAGTARGRSGQTAQAAGPPRVRPPHRVPARETGRPRDRSRRPRRRGTGLASRPRRGKLFRVGLYLTVYAHSREELADEVSSVRAVAESLLLRVQPATWRALAGWTSCLPLGVDQLAHRRTFDTSALAAAFPFSSPTSRSRPADRPNRAEFSTGIRRAVPGCCSGTAGPWTTTTQSPSPAPVRASPT
ncbi:hypothetical protein ACFQZC_08480 [Streptacidiphilus monticola]